MRTQLSNGGLRTMMRVALPAVDDENSEDDEFVLRRHELHAKAAASKKGRRASAPTRAPSPGDDDEDIDTREDELRFNARRRHKQRQRACRLQRDEANEAAAAAGGGGGGGGGEEPAKQKRRKQLEHAARLSRGRNSGQVSTQRSLEDLFGLGAALDELDVLEQQSYDRTHRMRRRASGPAAVTTTRRRTGRG